MAQPSTKRLVMVERIRHDRDQRLQQAYWRLRRWIEKEERKSNGAKE